MENVLPVMMDQFREYVSKMVQLEVGALFLDLLVKAFFFPQKFRKLEKNIKILILDIDECLANNGGCSENANCTNTIGSRDCVCNDGYEGNGTTCLGIKLFHFFFFKKKIITRVME